MIYLVLIVYRLIVLVQNVLKKHFEFIRSSGTSVVYTINLIVTEFLKIKVLFKIRSNVGDSNGKQVMCKHVSVLLANKSS